MFRSSFARLCATSAAGATTLPKLVDIIECPRDAMQGLRDFVPTDKKIKYINALLKCGFHTIDFGSFVSAPAVPQMRDTAEVLEGLDLAGSNSKLLAVVANIKGAVKASSYKNISYIGYPLSISETFQRKNTNRDIATALEDLRQVQNVCVKNDKQLVTYISMGFGNPYGEPYSEEIVADMVQKVVGMGCRVISLADTVGVSEPALITRLFTTLIPKYPDVTFGAHFHSGTVSSVAKVEAAVRSGCARLDGAIGGMGGCPFAKSTLVGNVSTEAIIEGLTKLGIDPRINAEALRHCQDIKHDIFGVAVKELILATTLKNEKEFVKLCQQHFNRHDKHNVGYLERKEFAEAMKEIFAELGEEPPSEERISAAYKKLDIAETGVITLDEYILGARKALSKRLKQMTLE